MAREIELDRYAGMRVRIGHADGRAHLIWDGFPTSLCGLARAALFEIKNGGLADAPGCSLCEAKLEEKSATVDDLISRSEVP